MQIDELLAAVIDKNEEPVTEEWLYLNGFRRYEGRRDERLPVRRLLIPGSSFGLSLDIARRDRESGEWHSWLAQEDPYRHIFIRYVSMRCDVIDLFQALSGQRWKECEDKDLEQFKPIWELEAE